MTLLSTCTPLKKRKFPEKTYKVYEIDLQDSHGAEVTLQIGENSDIALGGYRGILFLHE